MESESVLNPVAFKDALEMYGSEAVRFLCVQFLQEFQSCTKGVREEPGLHAANDLADQIHRFLGPCGVFGATGLYHIICQMETELRTNAAAPKLDLEEALEEAAIAEQEIIRRTSGPSGL